MAGYELRQEIQMQQIAWHAANTMNVHLKKRITVKQLLGHNTTSSKEERIAKFEQLKKKMNSGVG